MEEELEWVVLRLKLWRDYIVGSFGRLIAVICIVTAVAAGVVAEEEDSIESSRH